MQEGGPQRGAQREAARRPAPVAGEDGGACDGDGDERGARLGQACQRELLLARAGDPEPRGEEPGETAPNAVGQQEEGWRGEHREQQRWGEGGRVRGAEGLKSKGPREDRQRKAPEDRPGWGGVETRRVEPPDHVGEHLKGCQALALGELSPHLGVIVGVGVAQQEGVLDECDRSREGRDRQDAERDGDS